MEHTGLDAPKVVCLNLIDDERNPRRIIEGVQRELDNLAETEMSSIHLNFTGGTKPMSVYSKLAIDKWAEKHRGTRIILSDLSPRHRIVVPLIQETPVNSRSFPESGGDMREHVRVSVAGLLDLHNMKVLKEGHKQLSLPQEALLEFADKALDRFNQKGRDPKEIFQSFSCRKKIKIIRGEKREKEKWISKHSTEFESVSSEILKEFPSLKDFSSIEEDQQSPKASFVEYFEGKWLEDLLLHCLLELIKHDGVRIDEVKGGIEAHFRGRRTEIDVVAIQGYQLYLFSCTTSQRIKHVKQKAFEALYRAKELGGEHARVIVVSTMYNKRENHDIRFSEENNLAELQKDLQQFDATQHCHLIGIDELRAEVKAQKNNAGKRLFTQKLNDIFSGRLPR